MQNQTEREVKLDARIRSEPAGRPTDRRIPLTQSPSSQMKLKNTIKNLACIKFLSLFSSFFFLKSFDLISCAGRVVVTSTIGPSFLSSDHMTDTFTWDDLKITTNSDCSFNPLVIQYFEWRLVQSLGCILTRFEKQNPKIKNLGFHTPTPLTELNK